jgi:putative ABC transport system substrate-binding protein
MPIGLTRRELVALFGSAAATWPYSARAQERVRRVGVMHPGMGDDTESRARQAAFLKALQQLGWTEGRNLHIDLRFGGGDVARVRQHAEELVALAPDVVVASSSITAGALQAVTRSVPIVFVQAGDPVGQGLVPSLARPGGNTTGFTNFETSVSGKWLELLKEIAPGVTRAAVILDPSTTCRCRIRPSMNWRSTSGPRKCSASTCRGFSSSAPTR